MGVAAAGGAAGGAAIAVTPQGSSDVGDGVHRTGPSSLVNRRAELVTSVVAVGVCVCVAVIVGEAGAKKPGASGVRPDAQSSPSASRQTTSVSGASR